MATKQRATAEKPVPPMAEEPKVDEQDEELVDEQDDEPVVEPVAAKVVRKPKEVTVILQDASTMDVAGQIFRRNVPTKVPAEQAQLFREMGWFRVV